MKEQEMTLSEIHEGTLVVLKKILEICDKAQVTYFLAYGSLLGAVRHHGFIPWDDDLDLIMLRPDYDAFCRYCDAHAEELLPFKLMNRSNTPEYPYNISRFCDLRYRMESEDITDAGMGIFIDIYPYDGAGTDKAQTVKKVNRKKWLYMNCYFSAIRTKFIPSHRGIAGTLAKLPAHVFSKLAGYRYFLKKLEKLKDLYPLEQSSFIDCMVWDWPMSIIEKKYYESTAVLDFEGIPVTVPENYDAVLKACYGDYMQLPPEDQRVPHHEYRMYRKKEYFQSFSER